MNTDAEIRARMQDIEEDHENFFCDIYDYLYLMDIEVAIEEFLDNEKDRYIQIMVDNPQIENFSFEDEGMRSVANYRRNKKVRSAAAKQFEKNPQGALE